MINMYEVSETNKMIEQENLDVRTITLGISLMDCIDSDLNELNRKIYEKITVTAKDLVSTGKHIEREFGIPIVNKRISITPIALIGGAACKCPEDFVTIAETLDKAAKEVGVNFIGGYSALVSKGMTKSDENLIRSIPQALARTERVCSSVNVGSTRTGINMDAVRLCGEMVKETAEATKERDSFGCAKLVIFCNAPDDNPFMAGAFHGVGEADCVINVGVSGPGVVKRALMEVRDADFETLCEVVKKTAFKITRVGQLVAQEAAKKLNVPFGIIDLSLAPTPAVGDSVAEILEEIGKVAEKENIRLAQVTGLGAINDFTAGVYNTVTKEYHSIQFQGAFEIVSLTGTVTRKDGDVYLHLHIAAGDEEGLVHGGHLNRAIISATAEIQIQVIDGEIDREFSDEIGLNLFKF